MRGTTVGSGTGGTGTVYFFLDFFIVFWFRGICCVSM